MKNSKGITLLALVITIIVLLILAGISIGAITGNNSIINQAKKSKDETEIAEEKELLEKCVAFAKAKQKYGSLTKTDLEAELEIYAQDRANVDPESDDPIIVLFTDSGRNYLIDLDGEISLDETIIADRTGISIGDYITYTSPTASVTFTEAGTGYSTYATKPATVQAKTLFRVMDIDKYGNLTLMGAMKSEDSNIYLSGALGYNNAVYILNKKCSDLYENPSKGITARSIKIEDITDRLNQTGKDKITAYINNNMPTYAGTYIANIDSTNKKVTYKTRTNYPDIFQYEVGGIIDDTDTSGEIGQSESYSGYNGLTNLANKTPNPTSLTLTSTYYKFVPAASDFDNTKGNASAYQNMFFETDTYYWIASRCIDCYSEAAYFGVRCVLKDGPSALALYYSYNRTNNAGSCMCPVVNIPASVNITVSTDSSTYHKTVPHVVH